MPELTRLLAAFERRYGRPTASQWREKAAAEQDPIIRRSILRQAAASQFGEDMRDWPALPDGWERARPGR